MLACHAEVNPESSQNYRCGDLRTNIPCGDVPTAFTFKVMSGTDRKLSSVSEQTTAS